MGLVQITRTGERDAFCLVLRWHRFGHLSKCNTISWLLWRVLEQLPLLRSKTTQVALHGSHVEVGVWAVLLQEQKPFLGSAVVSRDKSIKMQALTDLHLLSGKHPAWCCGN